MSDAKKIALETSLDTRPVKQGLQEIVQAAETAATGVQSAGAKSGKAFDGVGAGAEASARKIENAEKSIIASIQRRTAAVQAAGQSESKYYEELARQRGVNTDALRPYLQQLDAAKARQDAATASLGNMGLSAKQTAAALRGVPAQFTDIATSLASGQAPLTVLLQQGGQLKDMFGGAGNAARALGGYVVGLINPFTIAAGAVTAIGVAAYQGASELQTLNKSLILSGGQAGVSGDQLMTMAAGIDAISTSITQSKAAATLDEIVKAGVRGEAQIRRYALAAAEFEVAGGGAAAKVAENFAELGRDPLQASVKLTQSMGYLTAATYEQIKSLEEQGRTLDAVKLAQDAYASALESRTPALLQNLGYMERGWLAVKNTAKEAWDAMLNVGRADTLADQIGTLEKRLAASRANPLVGSGFGQAQGRNRQAADEALLSTLKEQQRLSARAADATAARTLKEKERISWLQEGDKYLDKGARMEREIAKIKAQGAAAGASELEIEKRIAAVREKGASTPRRTRAPRDEFADVLNRVTMKEAGLDPNFYKDLNTLYDGYQKGRIGVEQYREAVETLVLAQRSSVQAQKEQSAAMAAAAQANNAAFDAEFEAIEKKRLSVESQIKSGREMLEQIQFETSLLGLNTQQREQAVAMRELERQGVVAGTQAYAAYGEQIKRAIASREQQQQALRFWQDLDQMAGSVFMDIAMNGEDAFKRIGQSIKREVIQLLYEMTLKKWIFQIAGVSTGSAGGGTDWVSLAGKAYDWYTGGSAGASAASTYSLASGASSGAGLTAGASGVGMTAYGGTGLTASATTTSTAAASGSAAASSSAWMTAAWYAAVIVAAVAVAENLYSKGYNRQALGEGGSESVRFGQYSGYTTNTDIQKSWMSIGILNLEAQNQRRLMDAVGISEKWADIFSGTTRMATLIGRKLGAYGYEADVAGGNAEVGGFARYKGGLFRSNKTVGIDIDQRDAAAVDAIVESTIEGARAMARAMGYSSDAIDAYTGSIRVNMKGANTAEEQSKRMAEAMDNLNFELLKTASGGKLARDDFKKLMDSIQGDIQKAGISAEGIADIFLQGMTGRISGADVGAQLADMVLGGIYNAIAGSAAAQVSNLFMTQIITPIFTAIAAGVPVTQAVSAAAMKATVESAKKYMAVVQQVFNDPEFQAWIVDFKGELNRAGGAAASVAAPAMRTYAGPSPGQLAAEEAKREREQLERELLRLQGNTAELRRRELLDLQPGNRALQQRIWALEDEQRITEERNSLEQQRLEIIGDTAALLKIERDALDESNRALFDQVQALKQVAELKDVWRDLTDSIEEEVKRIRGQVLGESSFGLAYSQAQFATLTGQARALDQAAAGQLPDLAGRLVDLYQTNAGSAEEYQFEVNRMLASLEETNRITRNAAGITESTSAVEDKALAKQVALLQASVETLQRTMEQNTAAAQVTSDALKRASAGGAIRTIQA